MHLASESWRWQEAARREFKVEDSADSSVLFLPATVSLVDYLYFFLGYSSLLGLVYFWVNVWLRSGLGIFLWAFVFTFWLPLGLLSMSGKLARIELSQRRSVFKVRYGFIFWRRLRFRPYKKRVVSWREHNVGRRRGKKRIFILLKIKDRLARSVYMLGRPEQAEVIAEALRYWNAQSFDPQAAKPAPSPHLEKIFGECDLDEAAPMFCRVKSQPVFAGLKILQKAGNAGAGLGQTGDGALTSLEFILAAQDVSPERDTKKLIEDPRSALCILSDAMHKDAAFVADADSFASVVADCWAD